MRRILTAITLALTLSSAAHAATDPALDKVLRQLDAASTQFKSAEADLKWDFYERVVRDTSSQSGSIYFLRTSGSTDMGALITSPSKKILSMKNGKGMLYDPSSAKRFTPFDSGNDKARYESFLTLGFGGSGKDLERAWQIKLLGTENISDGTQNVLTDKLDLVAKDPSVSSMFTHIVIWVDPARGISLRQESTTPEGDKRTATYTHIRYNTKIDTRKYAIPKN